jgi:hypothetical protein
MEGTVQEDDDRTEVQFKDKNLLKNQALPPQAFALHLSFSMVKGIKLKEKSKRKKKGVWIQAIIGRI